MATSTRSALEDFVRDYAEATAGAWDEVEPQVYDLLLADNAGRLDAPNVVRVAFDPEALPEHPGAQLASFGTPLVESFLSSAMRRGRFCQFYFLGLNLHPRDLAHSATRALALDGGLEFVPARVRALFFPQAIYWFQATFLSDQKESEIVPVAMDLHYGRLVRHRDRLLDPRRLSDTEATVLPEAPRLGIADCYPLALDEALRTLSTFAHVRDRDLKERLTRQSARMRRYYADLRAETDASPVRGKDPADAQAQRDARKLALDREEKSRITELAQKNSLRVDVKLLAAVLIQQPKFLIAGDLLPAKRPGQPLHLVWDPLLEATEPVSCPTCKSPTFKLGSDRIRGVTCPGCEKRPVNH